MKNTTWVAALFFGASAALTVLPAPAEAAKNVTFASGADADFVALREASLRGEIAESGRLAARLSDYAIPSYVEYYRLYPRLISAPEGEIRSFLERYDGTAIADRLRNDWLLILGRAHLWRAFDEQYPLFVLNDDTQVKCYAMQSRLAKGENIARPARELLVQPKYYGDACSELIIRLSQEKQFTDIDVWNQIRLASEYGFGGLARRLASQTDATEKQVTLAIDKPGPVLDRGIVAPRASRELFIIALGRVARDDHEKAARALNKILPRLSKDEQANAWAQIALPASLQLSSEAANYWRKSWGASLSADAYQWRARAALRIADWSMVGKAIEAMPRELQKDPAWVYWRGRAVLAEGKAEDAKNYFQSISSLSSFYGLLAIEELGQKIMVLAPPQPSRSDEIAEAAANPGFRNAFKFFDMEMRFEGNREWNWQLRKLSERQLLAAAEFARQSDVLDRMVTTADRARVELDYNHRYPAPHNVIMQAAVTPLGLDKAWVYGLIRQESRFVKAARSSVGASGLMQVMPATARYVAAKIGMTGYSGSSLNDTQTNILLGTNYLNMVLAKLGGSQTLATAAYNAGPSRPRLWRTSLAKPVEGAIFAETIPFSETRGYVKSVLANATWYAALFENKPQSLKQRLGVVTPKDDNLAELGDLP